MKNLMVLGLIAAIALPAQATINVGTRLMYGGFISKWEPVNDLRDPGKAPASTARVISGETELLLSNHSIKQASDPIQSIRLIPNRPGSPEFNLTHKLNPWSRYQSYIAADERGSIFPYIQGGRLGIHPNVMKHFNEYFANLSRKPVTLFLDIRFESGAYARYEFPNLNYARRYLTLGAGIGMMARRTCTDWLLFRKSEEPGIKLVTIQNAR